MNQLPDDIIYKIVKHVFNCINNLRLSVTNEKQTQSQVFQAIRHLGFIREYHLDNKSIPDFFYHGIAIEIKVKGEKVAIYRQCQRYCEFDQVKALILITNKSMGFPEYINGKPCYFFHIGKSWL